MIVQNMPYPAGGGGGGVKNPAFANVVLLCGFEGADGAQTFTDESSFARTLTAIGNAQIDTAEKKYGASSALFDGSGDRISVPHNANLTTPSGDFTYEMWVKQAATGRMGLLAKMASAASNSAFYMEVSSSGILSGRYYSGNTLTPDTNNSFPSDLGWHHVVFERSAGFGNVAVDGVFGQTPRDLSALPMNAGTDPLLIGARVQGSTVVSQMNGWIDEVRMTVGESVYGLQDFTPPTGPFARS